MCTQAPPRLDPASVASPTTSDLPADDIHLGGLVQAACQGCESSFARLHGLTKARLLEIVLRITRDRHQAEDVLQDVYLKAWTRCAQFDATKGPALHWLSGISRNSAVDSLRRHRRHPLGQGWNSPEAEDDPYADLASPEPGPMQALHRLRLLEAVQIGLAGLPTAQRQAVTLAYLEERSHLEIARQLGQPLGTVKSWIRRSVTVLQPLLQPHR